MQVIIFTDVTNNIGFGRYAGAYRIATELRANGFTTQVIDLFSELTLTNIKQLIEKYVGADTLVVGFSTTLMLGHKNENSLTDKNFSNINLISWHKDIFPHNDEFMKIMVSSIKNKNANCKIVLGGAKAAQHIDFVDYYIMGEGEVSIVKLCQRLYEGKSLFKTLSIPYNDFNTSIITWADNDFLFDAEHVPIEISRGCIFRCKFCSFNMLNKKPDEYIKSTEHFKSELIRNYDQHNITGYMISDDTYNDSIQKVESYHKMFTSLPFKPEWTSYCRIDLFSKYPEMAILLKESGLKSVLFGIETFNHLAGKTVGKGLAPGKVKDILYYLKDVWGDEVMINANFIAGLPFETKDDLYNTCEWLSSPNCPIDGFNFTPLYISNNSASSSIFGETPEKFGITFDRLTGFWKHATMNKIEAHQIVDDMHNTIADPNRIAINKIGFYNRLRNLNYTYDEIHHMCKNGVDLTSISWRKHIVVKNYIAKLI